ncbi:MAG: 30S ribosomal protein S16 [Mycobacteriales bacterium]
MAVKIKLMRLGKMRAPYYRIVVADARTKREGRVIETIGKYHPKENPSFMEVDGDRAAYWLGVGAQPTEPVAAILKVTGDWQKFKGLPAPPPMLVAEPKPDRKAIFETAARESGGEAGGAATTPKKKAAPKVKADDDTAPAGHAAPSTGEPTSATPTPAEGKTDPSAGDGPTAEAPSGDGPTAAEAGTGQTTGTDAATAPDAADAASADKA